METRLEKDSYKERVDTPKTKESINASLLRAMRKEKSIWIREGPSIQNPICNDIVVKDTTYYQKLGEIIVKYVRENPVEREFKTIPEQNPKTRKYHLQLISMAEALVNLLKENTEKNKNDLEAAVKEIVHIPDEYIETKFADIWVSILKTSECRKRFDEVDRTVLAKSIEDFIQEYRTKVVNIFGEYLNIAPIRILLMIMQSVLVGVPLVYINRQVEGLRRKGFNDIQAFLLNIKNRLVKTETSLPSDEADSIEEPEKKNEDIQANIEEIHILADLSYFPFSDTANPYNMLLKNQRQRLMRKLNPVLITVEKRIIDLCFMPEVENEGSVEHIDILIQQLKRTKKEDVAEFVLEKFVAIQKKELQEWVEVLQGAIQVVTEKLMVHLEIKKIDDQIAPLSNVLEELIEDKSEFASEIQKIRQKADLKEAIQSALANVEAKTAEKAKELILTLYPKITAQGLRNITPKQLKNILLEQLKNLTKLTPDIFEESRLKSYITDEQWEEEIEKVLYTELESIAGMIKNLNLTKSIEEKMNPFSKEYKDIDYSKRLFYIKRILLTKEESDKEDAPYLTPYNSVALRNEKRAKSRFPPLFPANGDSIVDKKPLKTAEDKMYPITTKDVLEHVDFAIQAIELLVDETDLSAVKMPKEQKERVEARQKTKELKELLKTVQIVSANDKYLIDLEVLTNIDTYQLHHIRQLRNNLSHELKLSDITEHELITGAPRIENKNMRPYINGIEDFNPKPKYYVPFSKKKYNEQIEEHLKQYPEGNTNLLFYENLKKIWRNDETTSEHVLRTYLELITEIEKKEFNSSIFTTLTLQKAVELRDTLYSIMDLIMSNEILNNRYLNHIAEPKYKLKLANAKHKYNIAYVSNIVKQAYGEKGLPKMFFFCVFVLVYFSAVLAELYQYTRMDPHLFSA